MMDSPGGGMSEDSAYGSPENRGKVSKARGGGLGGLASFALGTAVAALATMGLNTTRGDALKRATFDRAKDASRGVQAMARKTSSAVRDAVDKKAAARGLRGNGGAASDSTHETCGRTTRPPPRSIDTVAKTRAVSSVRACKTTVGSRQSSSTRLVNLWLATNRRRSVYKFPFAGGGEIADYYYYNAQSEFAARNARRERVLLRLKASMVSSRE